jgi:hypothetical protein
LETFALKYSQPNRGFKTSTKDLFLFDYKLKPLRQTLQRQIYFPKNNSFQMDIIDVHSGKNKSKKNQLYLVLININTRYLYIYPLKKKDSDNLAQTLIFFIRDVVGPISSITADGTSFYKQRSIS